MDLAHVGGNHVTHCPYCDDLFSVKVAGDDYRDSLDRLMSLYQEHFAASPQCQEEHAKQPSIRELLASMGAAMAEADCERQQRVESNPHNGTAGYWLVQGIRHDARTFATSASEAIERCSSVVGDWESPEATFIGETLPDVF